MNEMGHSFSSIEVIMRSTKRIHRIIQIMIYWIIISYVIDILNNYSPEVRSFLFQLSLKIERKIYKTLIFYVDPTTITQEIKLQFSIQLHAISRIFMSDINVEISHTNGYPKKLSKDHTYIYTGKDYIRCPCAWGFEISISSICDF